MIEPDEMQEEQNRQPVYEVIMNLLFSYATKQEPPGSFEIMAVEEALPYVRDYMNEGTYQSTLEWVQRNKEKCDLYK